MSFTDALAYLREFNITSVILRLALAMAAGSVLGYGRSRKRHSAGMRTYMLVSIGAALTILISMYEYEMFNSFWAFAREYTDLKYDGARFSSQVINGVGFLAAGTIISAGHQQVSGMTTAIGLFVSACLGIAAGSGFYECVLIAVPLIVIAMEALRPIETLYKRRLRNITIYIEFDAISDIGFITNAVTRQGAKVFDIDVEHTEYENGQSPSAILALKLDKHAASHSAMLSSLAELPCVYAVQELIS